MERRTLSPLAVTCAAALVYGSTAMAQDGASVGALMPMTGALAEYGESSLNAIQLAAQQINDAGGVLGGEFKVVVGDTQTNPQAGVAAAQQLVSANQVAALIGALSSGVTIPVSQSVSASNSIPQVSTASTAPSITTLEDNDFLFRTTPHDALQGIVLGDMVNENDYSKVAVVYVNNDYGKGLAEAFSNRFNNLGGEVSSSIAYEEKQASYRGELSQAADGDPEALVLIAYPGDGIPILKQAIEEGFFQKFIMTDGMKSTDTIEAIGPDFLEGTLGTAPEAVTDTPAAEFFRSSYETAHGEIPPRPFMDTAYDATFLLALAIQKAGSTEGTAIRDALREVASPPGETILPGEWAKAVELMTAGEDIDYQGAAGSQDFDAAGDVPGTFGIWTITGGEIKTLRIVEPEG